MVRSLAVVAAMLVGAICPALAWDYRAGEGDGIYVGHSTAQFNTTEQASLAFACTKSARGAPMFLLETTQRTWADGEDLVIPVEVGGKVFEIDAVLVDAGGVQQAMTWGLHAAVNDAITAIFEADGPVLVSFGSEQYEFAAANRGKRFERTLDVCGRPN